ncbi:hypothetical protein O181_072965 [Austropuccinia psidii MF-1]|uniref:Uncharacterized protein n=1 Tax=Austropuccinia psidii MF-1 TaxID=1389203 RepID=A0A9Q3F1J5_9BASI|nr:hypothetical protein [Austropuccinia psidii MF-1]
MMAQITQSVAPRDNSRAPELKTTSMKAPVFFDGTQAHKLRGFIQSCQLIFHNDTANLFSDRKKVLDSTALSLVELENGLNHISQISLMKTHPISSITGSCFKHS